jgi:hypothetical protein
MNEKMKKVSYFLSIALAASMFVACNQKKAAEEAVAFEFTVAGEESETEVTTEDSALTYVVLNKPQVSNLSEAPKDKDGFISLFDGKTFNGWRGYLKDEVPGRWIIEDEAIKFNGSGAGEAQNADGGDIIFAHKFKNFELTFDWKVAKGSNSGILYLAQEVKGEPIYISSPEYQILDNENHPDAQLGENGNRKSSSLYDMISADPQNSNPFGEWNTGSIIVYKGTVIHKQNGKVVLEYHLWTPQWTELLQKSKFSQEKWPLAFELLNNLGGAEHEGYIGLQDHGDDVWYKNIKIKITD